MAKKKNNVIECAHCGNRTSVTNEKTATVTEQVESAMDPDGMEVDYYYSLVRCGTCEGISLLLTGEYMDDPGDFTQAKLCYPPVSRIPSGLPKMVAKEFSEALKIERASPAAYAVMIGRALESLCKDQQAKGRTLEDQLEDLSTREIIPKKLCEIGQTLRFLRNKGAHAGDYEIDRNEARAMGDFFSTMLEYVYVAPAKLERLKKSIEKKKSLKATK